MADPKNPLQPKMRDWPMFQVAREKRSRRARSSVLDGSPLPGIADLIMAHVPGTPSQQLAWLRRQIADGKLEGDDPEEILQAEALLTMLKRISESKGGTEKRHLDELLDEGLKGTFPASDPVAVGHFTATEPSGQPLDRTLTAAAPVGKSPRKTVTRLRRFG